jgi:hypothetical protein
MEFKRNTASKTPWIVERYFIFAFSVSLRVPFHNDQENKEQQNNKKKTYSYNNKSKQAS